MALPSDPAARKRIPLATGLLDYFPDALEAIAAVSFAGNEQHNPGQPLHWDRTKSVDHADCAMRHFRDRGALDGDGHRHTAKMAWRALAMLQIEIEEADGLPPPRGALGMLAPVVPACLLVNAHPMAAEALREANAADEALAA